MARRCAGRATPKKYCGKNVLDGADKRKQSALRNVLGVVMVQDKNSRNGRPSLLDVVALLKDRPADKLARGQVGTIVEVLDGGAALVEFSDDQGRAYAVAPCTYSELIVLHYVPQAA